MSKIITFQLPIIEMQHLSGATLTCLAADMQTWFLAQPSRALAQSFARAAKKALLQEGQYLELLKYLPAATAELSKIKIEVPASKKRCDEKPGIHKLTSQSVSVFSYCQKH